VSTAELWEREAAGYDRVYDDPGRRGRLVRARLETTLALLPDRVGAALDVGMGGGRLVEALDERGWDVAGTDASETMVELARARVPGRAGAISQAPIERLPFPDGSFDVVVALGVVEYSDDVVAALRELARVLLADGTAVVSFPNFDGLRSRVRLPLRKVLRRVAPGRAGEPPRHALGEGRFRDLLDGAGLDVADVQRLGAHGQSTGRLGASQLVYAARKRPS
jgi:SAM-dependent methyltransferase